MAGPKRLNFLLTWHSMSCFAGNSLNFFQDEKNIRATIHDDVLDPEPAWMSYEFRTAHPVLRWLPTKLAEWIGANLSEELPIADKIEDRWTAAELNTFLRFGVPSVICARLMPSNGNVTCSTPQVRHISYTMSYTMLYTTSYTI